VRKLKWGKELAALEEEPQYFRRRGGAAAPPSQCCPHQASAARAKLEPRELDDFYTHWITRGGPS